MSRDLAALATQVREAERAFAKTMADRDHAAFGTFSSSWRREPDGKWRVVFDEGCPPSRCPE